MAVVLNTRPADQNGELSDLLRQAGFEPRETPMVDIVADEEGLKRLRRLQPSGFTGIFLSSPNGLRQMQAGLLATELEPWLHKPFYLVGGKAATLVKNAGGKVAFFPEEASLEGFLKEYPDAAKSNGGNTHATGPAGLVLAQRWLHPCSASTRLEPAAFKRLGVDVENVPVYKPGLPADAAALLAKEGQDAEAVVFCSASAVENFHSAAPELSARLGKPDGLLVVSIGPSTTKALQDRGVANIKQAEHADNPSIVDALKSAVGGMATKVLKKKNPNPEKQK